MNKNKFTLKKDGKYFTADYSPGTSTFKQGFWAPSLESCYGAERREIAEGWQKEHGGEIVEYTRAFGRLHEVHPEPPPVPRPVADRVYVALNELVRHLGGEPDFDILRHSPFWDNAIEALRYYHQAVGVPHVSDVPFPDVRPPVSP